MIVIVSVYKCGKEDTLTTYYASMILFSITLYDYTTTLLLWHYLTLTTTMKIEKMWEILSPPLLCPFKITKKSKRSFFKKKNYVYKAKFNILELKLKKKQNFKHFTI